MRLIVEHNEGIAGVYFTYTSGNLFEDFQLTSDGTLYEAKPKLPP